MTKLSRRKRATPTEKTTGFLWQVEVKYKLIPAGGLWLKPVGATKWQVDVAIQSVPVETPVTKDLDGNIIANTLGEPIECNRVVYDEVTTVTFTTDAPAWSVIDGALGAINEEAFTLTVGGQVKTYPALSTLFENYTFSKSISSEGDELSRITYYLHRRPQVRAAGDNWHFFFPNKSLYTKSLGFIRPIVDDFGQPVTEPRYIDELNVPIPTGEDVYLNEFNVIEAIPFTDLLDEIP